MWIALRVKVDMVTLSFFLLVMVVVFGIIGASRGWVKELLVTFSVILGIFIVTVLVKYVPYIHNSVSGGERFWMRAIVMGAIIAFGYQTPNIPKLAATNKFMREKLQDSMLGALIGAFNGFLIFGALWYYMHVAGYPFAPEIIPPQSATEAGDFALGLFKFLAPYWLVGPSDTDSDSPVIYFAVALCFAFILMVFL